MGAEFIEQRRAALQVFLIKVVSHPYLKDSPELAAFLKAGDEQWTLEMAKWQAETSARSSSSTTHPASLSSSPYPSSSATPLTTTAGAIGSWFRSLQHSAQNMVSGRSDDSMEDPEYLRVRDYISSLEGHLSEAQRQAGRMGRKEAELAGALAAFGNSAEQLGKFDPGQPGGPSSVRISFDVLCARAGQVAAASKRRSDALSISFEAPLRELARGVKCVQAAFHDRSLALSAYVQVKGDLDGKKVKLAKLRGTPGLQEARIAEAERDVTEAEDKVRGTKLAYDTIASRMTEELNRYQKERAAETGALLRGFALDQVRFASEDAVAWSALLQDIMQQQQQQQQALQQQREQQPGLLAASSSSREPLTSSWAA